MHSQRVIKTLHIKADNIKSFFLLGVVVILMICLIISTLLFVHIACTLLEYR